MSTQPVTHNTFVIERLYPASPERVFAAFSDKAIKTRWYADGRDLAVDQFDMDFRTGGRDVARFRMGEKTPFPGTELIYNITYQDIVPNRRLVYAYSLSFAGKIISASLVTFELEPAENGTALQFTEQGAYFEGADGPQIRQQGWNTLLDKLGAAVKA